MNKIVVHTGGRITIPKEVRELLKSKRLKLKIEDGKIILEPVVLDVNKYYGIFKKDIGNEDIDEILNKALAEVLLNDK
ncbi:AbrB family transcriptional regulator [Stygiolobus sp. CP850M]|uniref:AbrB family transcriptional regulator n=1 Tax=Stygiolobus sp. CP850M TaxID=3133134 RepID=UPI00307E936F